MKGVTGLVIALTLAIAGGICNWLYVRNQADRYERENFIYVKVDQIRKGDKFNKDDFGMLQIPKNNLGNLEKVAQRWDDLPAITDFVAQRDFVRGQVLLQDDLTTVASTDLNEKIGPNERIIQIPVDPRTFTPRHVNPGDVISFRVPRYLGSPRPAAPGDGVSDPPPEEIIGPFRILALGNRRGRPEPAIAAGQRFGQENAISIAVEIRGDELEPKAQRILDLLAMTNFKGVQVLIHPSIDSD